MKILLLVSFIFFALGAHAQLELDTDFADNVGAGLNGQATHALQQDDGKIVIVGSFTEFNGTARENLLRLNADGSLDVSFDAGATFSGSVINDIDVDGLGNIYVSGNFTEKVIKLTSAGAVDASFTFDDTNLSGPIGAIAVDQNNRLLAGELAHGDGSTCLIGRFNTDGTEHFSFIQGNFEGESGASFNAQINDIVLDNDNNIMVAGVFTAFPNMPSGQENLVRLNGGDGTYDPTFERSVVDGELRVFFIKMHDDGKMTAYNFLSNIVGAYNRIERYNFDGSIDEDRSFFDGGIRDLDVDGEQPVLIAGTFSSSTQGGGLSAGVGTLLYSNLQNASFTSGNGYRLISDFAYSGGENVEVAFYDGNEGAVLLGNFESYAGEQIAGGITRLQLCNSITIGENTNNFTVCEGETASFAVDASSADALTYQWKILVDGLYQDLAEDGTYSGTTSATLNIQNTSISLDGTAYKCVVDDGNCSKSVISTLNVLAPTVITEQPESASFCENSQATFTANVSGAVGNNNQRMWQVDSLNGNGFQDGGLTSSLTLTLGNVTMAMNGFKYRFVVSACNEPVISDEAVLTVNSNPVITEFPLSTSVCGTGDASFSVATSTQDVSYQWQIFNRTSGVEAYENLSENSNYSGTNTAQLEITAISADFTEFAGFNSTNFKCIITSNATGCTAEASPQLTIVAQDSQRDRITQQPEDRIECNTGSGRNLGFQIQTDLVLGESIQWQVDSTGTGFIDLEANTKYNNVNNNTLNLTGITSADNAFQYRAMILPCGEVSTTVQTNVNERPNLTISENMAVCLNSQVTISVESDQQDVSYQWQFRNASQSGSSFQDIADNATYSGTNTSDLQILTNFANDFGSSQNQLSYRYICVVTSANETCSRTSPQNTLTVYKDVTFNNDGGSEDVCEGGEQNIGLSANTFGAVHELQWQYAQHGTTVFVDLEDDQFISNTRSTNLSIDSAIIAFDSGFFRMIVRGCETDFISDTTQLFVSRNPVVTESPETQVVCREDGSVEFGAAAVGDELLYSWQRATEADGEFSDFSSTSAQPALTLNTQDLSLSGSFFRCRIINGTCGQEVFTSPAQLIINQIDIISNVTVKDGITNYCDGEPTYVTLEAEGENLSYQWQIQDGNFTNINDNDNFTGSQSDTLFINMNEDIINYQLRCIVSGNCPEKTSEIISLGIIQVPVPEITVQSENPDLILGSTQSYNSYIWYQDGEEFSTDAQIQVSEEGVYTLEGFLNGCSKISESFEVELEENGGILSNSKEYLISIHPNPAAQSINLTLADLFEPETIVRLFSVDGKLQIELKLDHSNIELDVSALENGIYFISIHNKKGDFRKRFVKN